MKRICLISILLGLGVISANSQDSIVSIPDSAFLKALIDNGVDTNGDGLISYAEAEEVISLDVSYKDISNLSGIEAFTIMDTLDCSNNELTSLDISGNPKLKYLDCGGYWLIVIAQLTTLDVSNNTELEHLDCGSSLLSSLDLSNNKALKYLDCGITPMDTLDLTNNSALEFLYCDHTNLTSLDLSKNTSLIVLNCDNNDLTSLDVSNNTALEYLSLDRNNNLTSLVLL